MSLRAAASPGGQNLRDLIPPLLAVCEDASAAILEAYDAAAAEVAGASAGDPGSAADRGGGFLREKADRSPLTVADVASHRIIEAGLAGISPSLPVLSEESAPADVAGRRSWSELWMVDPLDGTREFLERTGEFTINIALIARGRPILGVIFEPLSGAGSVGLVGDGAWRYRRSDRDRGDWEVQPLATRSLPARRITVLSSRRHRNERLAASLAFLEHRYGVARQNSGSALKFCDLAAGSGDVYPRYSACSEWDVAAGDALVTAAGGAVWGMDRRPLVYNDRDTLISPHFLAVGDPAPALWGDLLAALP
jgi:3'(2'), 5'-bisphosphate nucleotidase